MTQLLLFQLGVASCGGIFLMIGKLLLNITFAVLPGIAAVGQPL